MLFSGFKISLGTCLPFGINLQPKYVSRLLTQCGIRTLVIAGASSQKHNTLPGNKLGLCWIYCQRKALTKKQQLSLYSSLFQRGLLQAGAALSGKAVSSSWRKDHGRPSTKNLTHCTFKNYYFPPTVCPIRHAMSEASLSSVAPTFVVMRFDQEGNVTTFEKKKTELCQELSLQARDLRFQHSTSLTARNNCIILRMETLKAIVTLDSLQVLDFRGVGLERWLVLELAPQLATQTHSLPFEFRAIEAILQHRVNALQTRKSLSELETDIKVFKDSLLKILDEDEMIEELCLTKWTDPRIFEESSLGIDHAEEMELLLENYYMQAEEFGNKARELKGLIDDSESVIFINLDSHRNSSFEEDPKVFWLVTGFMFLGSGLIWRKLLSFLGRHLEPSLIPPVWKRNLKEVEMRNFCLVILVGLAAGFFTEKISVSSQHLSAVDDLYLEGRPSGDLPIDDEDGDDDDGSGSGSGDGGELLKFLNFSKTSFGREDVTVEPLQPQPTSGSPNFGPTTAAKHPQPSTTESDSAPKAPTASDNDEEIVAKDGRGSRIYEMDSPKEVMSENLWERTDVLAAIIACGVVGFLFAVFLLLLLAYRMKKKDEGSYDLGETKLTNTAYHKAPTKEFYA
ncbi:hypothetical protein WMY93_026847 [Mugilogobius chulae]|uniref:Magnesium transporter n=1 Tax=Mugilogobius chulae TaxID=88201 RepID=A0AAW0N3J4_9GOBI